jgi:hypothetical protein
MNNDLQSDRLGFPSIIFLDPCSWASIDFR